MKNLAARLGEGAGMLVVIDPRVEAYRMLAAGVHQGANVLILDPNRDGIEQITEALLQTATSTLHIVCHGSPGCLYLGKTPLSLANLEHYRNQLSAWGVREILLYACYVAADEKLPITLSSHHSPFLDCLHHLTGANIAASQGRIGNAAKGGSWQLEDRSGQIARRLAFIPAIRQAYPGVFVAFGNAINFGVGQWSFDIAKGDFDGDGNPDLVVVNGDDDNISVLLGDGAGSFGAATNFSVGNQPGSVAVGDFNGDRNLDLVVVNTLNLSNNISVLLGDGTGNFSTATNFGAGAFPQFVAVGDFNGDSNLDLAVTNFNSDNVSVLLGNGTGNFSAATNFGVGNNPEGVVVEDFNRDGNPDLAVTNAVSDNISVLLGDGAGSFGTATNFAVGDFPAFLTVGDFNGDGNSDLAVANLSSDNISVLLGDGIGSFGVASNLSTGDEPTGIAARDFDGDNNLDLVVTNRRDDNVSVFLGDGTGGFSAGTNFATGRGPTAIAVDDFNSDTKLDIVTLNYFDQNVSLLVNTIPLVTIASGTTPNETDATKGSFTITLSDPAPVGGLTVNFTVTGNATNPADYSLAASTNITALTANSFTIAPGVTTATVEVVPVDDNLPDLSETVELTLTPGDNYIVGAASNASLTITDNDTANVTITQSGGSTEVTEGSMTDSYEVVLNTVPTAPVTITIDPDDDTDLGAGSGNPILLNFAADATVLIPQTVSVTAVDDTLVEGAHTSTIIHTAASNDPNYNGIAIPNIIANITDNDTANVTITQSGGSTEVTEGSVTDSYEVVLNTVPTAPVTITIDPDDDTDLGAGSGNPILLNFAADATALIPQTVSVTAVDDTLVEGAHTSTIIHTAASNDPNYNGIVIPNIIANITDNDTGGGVPLALNPNPQDNIFLIEGDPTQAANLRFTLVQSNASFINEVGVFAVNDDKGGLDIDGDGQTDVNPGDPNYVTQALAQGKAIFSALSSDFVTSPTRILQGFNGSERLVFYLLSNSTTDAVLAGKTTSTSVLLSSTFGGNGFEPLQVSDFSNGEFTLRWEDQPSGGDEDFDDLVLTFGLTNNSPPPGTLLQGSQQGEVVDLRQLAINGDGVVDSEVSASFVVNSEAAFDNYVGLYRVDSIDGRINNLLPGQAGYAQAAIERSVLSFNRDGIAPVTLSGEQLGLLVPYLIADGTPQEFLASNPNNLEGEGPLAYFNYLGANPDGVDHLRLLADNAFGFEDIFDGGDFDYNDMVFQVSFS